MELNNPVLNNIIKSSPVKIAIQNNWVKVHKKFIKDNIIEPLTYTGLIQAIDNVAYQIYLNSKLCIELGLTDEESDILLEDNINKLDEIVRVISLASGIHPITIDLMVGFRTDHYTDYHVASSNTL